jgi:hypothetical protein
MNTTHYNTAGELQGIIISKDDLNFQEAIVNAMEIIDSHPEYNAHVMSIAKRIFIGKKHGNDVVSIQIANIDYIQVTEEAILISCNRYDVAIQFSEPTFIIC